MHLEPMMRRAETVLARGVVSTPGKTSNPVTRIRGRAIRLTPGGCFAHSLTLRLRLRSFDVRLCRGRGKGVRYASAGAVLWR